MQHGTPTAEFLERLLLLADWLSIERAPELCLIVLAMVAGFTAIAIRLLAVQTELAAPIRCVAAFVGTLLGAAALVAVEVVRESMFCAQFGTNCTYPMLSRIAPAWVPGALIAATLAAAVSAIPMRPRRN